MTIIAAGEALEVYLRELQGLPQIIWPNTKEDTPKDGQGYVILHLKVAHNYLPPTRIGIDPRLQRRLGVMTIAIVGPRDRGQGASNDLGKALIAAFPADMRLPVEGGGQVRVTVDPTVGGPIRAAATWRLPVSVNYEFHGPV